MSLSLIRSGAGCVGGMTGDSRAMGGTAGSSEGIAQGTGRSRRQPKRLGVGRIVFQERFSAEPKQQAKRDDNQQEDEGEKLADDAASEPQLEGLKPASPSLERVRHQHTHGERNSHRDEAPSRFRRHPSFSCRQPQNRKRGHQRCAGFEAFGQ